MAILFQLLNVALCIFMAKMDAKTIQLGRYPKHWLNATIHVTMAVFGWLIFGWPIGLAVLFESNLAFNIALNTFRDLSIGYVPPKPTSLIDKLEKKIFGKNGLLPKIIYLVISIILNFL